MQPLHGVYQCTHYVAGVSFGTVHLEEGNHITSESHKMAEIKHWHELEMCLESTTVIYEIVAKW